MTGKVGHLPALWQTLGPEWLFNRVWYAARRRAGLLRLRLPSEPWPTLEAVIGKETAAGTAEYLEHRRQSAPPFLFKSDARAQFAPLLQQWDDDERSPMATASEIANGELRYYGHTQATVGLPPQWHRNPFSGEEAPADRHWSEIGDFEHGDVKTIWEASRFGFAYTLVRAYWRTGDERYPQLFWQLIEDWLKQNPPQLGPNWKCGQETSFRTMAWTFGLYGFLDSPETTSSRAAAMAVAMSLFARRIEANLSYALNQQNNHGISEGMGLWTIGTLFPELRGAARWQRKGRQVLEEQGHRLIYDDGAFSQHSLNYQRLMLHDYIWCLRLADIVGRPFSTPLQDRVARAASFLAALQLGAEGQTPRYGHNDGALILPLSNCAYDDYRPLIQAAHFQATGKRLYPPGPWDEDLLWLFGPQALQATPETENRRNQEDLFAQQSGYYTIHSAQSSAFVRCGPFRHRPGHADLLHLDVWYQGRNVARDPGTYSYNAPPPWNTPLAATRYHNTVTVDDREQMDRFSRFLWLPWARGELRARRRSDRGHLAYWEGHHDGYRRLQDPVSYRRAVIALGPVHWLVLDHLHSLGTHNYRLHWLLPDYPYRWQETNGALLLEMDDVCYRAQVGALDSAPEVTLVRADPDSPRGWCAPHYYERQPALSLAACIKGAGTTFWSLLGPDNAKLTAGSEVISVVADQWRATVNLAVQPATTIVDAVRLEEDITDKLELTT